MHYKFTPIREPRETPFFLSQDYANEWYQVRVTIPKDSQGTLEPSKLELHTLQAGSWYAVPFCMYRDGSVSLNLSQYLDVPEKDIPELKDALGHAEKSIPELKTLIRKIRQKYGEA